MNPGPSSSSEGTKVQNIIAPGQKVNKLSNKQISKINDIVLAFEKESVKVKYVRPVTIFSSSNK